MIVNMPTDEEMTAAVALADKKGWDSTESGVSPSQAANYDGPDSTTYHPWTYARSQPTSEKAGDHLGAVGQMGPGSAINEDVKSWNRPASSSQGPNYTESQSPYFTEQEMRQNPQRYAKEYEKGYEDEQSWNGPAPPSQPPSYTESQSPYSTEQKMRQNASSYANENEKGNFHS
jgi:hypothetical protein